MTNNEFANKLAFAFISESIEPEDIEKMIYRGFIKNGDIYYKAYLNNKEGFMEKYKLYKETEHMLTAGEMFDKLRKSEENITEYVPDPQTLNEMAENGLFSEDEVIEITGSADASAQPETTDLEDEIIAAKLKKEYKFYLFDESLCDFSIDKWKELSEKLPEKEIDEEEFSLDEQEDEKEPEEDNKENNKAIKEEEQDEIITETVIIEKEKKKTSNVSSPESVAIPLSDGSYIVVGTSNDNSVPEYKVPETPNNLGDQLLTKAGLYEIVDYVKSKAPDETYQLQVVKYSSDGSREEIVWGSDEHGIPVGSAANFELVYSSGKEIPEYEGSADVDKVIQYKLGAVDYSDGSHDTEYYVEKDETSGVITVHWEAPEYVLNAPEQVLEEIINRSEYIAESSDNRKTAENPVIRVVVDINKDNTIEAQDLITRIQEQKEADNKSFVSFASLGFTGPEVTEKVNETEFYETSKNAVSIPLPDGTFVTVASENATQEEIKQSIESAKKSFSSPSVNLPDFTETLLAEPISETAIAAVVNYVRDNAQAAGEGIQLIKTDSFGKQAEIHKESENGLLSYGTVFDEYYASEEHIASSPHDDAVIYILGSVSTDELKENISITSDETGTDVVSINIPEGIPVTSEVYSYLISEAQEIYMKSLSEERQEEPLNVNYVFGFSSVNEEGEKAIKTTGSEELSGILNELNTTQKDAGTSTERRADLDPYENYGGGFGGGFGGNDFFDDFTETGGVRVLVNTLENDIEMGVINPETGELDITKVPEITPDTAIRLVLQNMDINGEEVQTEMDFTPNNDVTKVRRIGLRGVDEISFIDFRSELLEHNNKDGGSVEKLVGLAQSAEKASIGVGMVIATEDGFHFEFSKEWLEAYADELLEAQKLFGIQPDEANAKVLAYKALQAINKMQEMDFNPEHLMDMDEGELTDIDRLNELFPDLEEVEELTDEQKEKIFLNRLEIANKQTKENYQTKFERGFSFISTNLIFQQISKSDVGMGLYTMRNAARTAGMVFALGPLSVSKEMELYANKKFAASLYNQYQEKVIIPGLDEIEEADYKKIDFHSAKSRREAIKDVEIRIRQNKVLNRAAIHKMSVADLKKIMEEGKIAGVALNATELNLIHEILVLKGVNIGDLEAINAVNLINKVYGLSFSDKYNINSTKDLHAMIAEIDNISMNEKYAEAFGGLPISLLSKSKIQEILEDENTSEEIKNLLEAHIALQNFQKEKLIAKQEKRSAKSSLKYLLIRSVQKTDFGRGLSYLRRRYRLARTLLHAMYLVQKLINNHALARQVKRMNDPNSKYNQTRFGQWTNKRLKDRLENGTKWQQYRKKSKENRATWEQTQKDKIKKKVGDSKKRVIDKKNKAKASVKNTKLATRVRKGRAGKIGAKVKAKAGRAGEMIKVMKEIEVFNLGSILTKYVSLKAAVRKFLLGLLKYVAIFLAIICLMQISVSFLGMAADLVSGFLYNKNTGIVATVGSIIRGTGEDGDEKEYDTLSTEDTLVSDRVEYCLAMDSALKAYVESWYTNDNLIKSLTEAKDGKLEKEEGYWYNPISKKTLKDSLDKIGNSVSGINTGIHYTYYNFDGEVISMKSNAKDIVATANAWIGSDLTAKGLYKSYVEALWNYTHAVGYSLRPNYGNSYVYSCDSHSEYSECFDNIKLYYCNNKDGSSDKLYDAVNNPDGSTLHAGLDIQVTYDDTNGTVNSGGKTIGTNTVVSSGDEHTQNKKDSIKHESGSYSGESAIGGTFTYQAADGDNTEYLLYAATIAGGSSYGTASIQGTPGATYTTDGKTLSWRADNNGSIQTFTDKGSEGTRDKIYQYLIGTMGFNKAAASGVMGNIYVECNDYKNNKPYNFSLIEKNGAYFYSGLVMWQKDGGELGNLAYQYASTGDLESQLQLLNKSMNNGYAGYPYGDLVAQLKAVPNTEEGARKAAEIFAVYYENCKGTSYSGNAISKGYKTGIQTVSAGTKYQGLSARKDTASALFGYYNGLSSTPTVSSTATSSSSGTPATAGVSNFVMPLESYSISCNYGVYSDGTGHPGTDFISGKKTIYSISDGKVLCAYSDTVKGSTKHGKFGNVIVIESEVTNSDGSKDTVRFLYAHTQYPTVSAGQTVKAGDPIGIVGDTGNTTGPHLHLEARIVKTDGTFVRVNPLKYITTGEKTTTGCPSSSAYTDYDPSKKSGSGSETGSGITGSLGGYTAGSFSGTTVEVAALYRTPVNARYGTSEKGSWLWVESSNGCQRHEITYCSGSGKDVTSEVLSSMADANISLADLGIDNRTTLYPESSIVQPKFYSSSSGFRSGCAHEITYGAFDSNGEVVQHKAYYCPGHVDGCSESKTVNKDITYNVREQHTGTSAITLNSPAAGARKEFYKAGSIGGCDHMESVSCNKTKSTSTHISGVPRGSDCIVELLHQNSSSATYSGSCNNYEMKQGTYYCTSSREISSSQLSYCNHYQSEKKHYQSGYSSSGYLGYYIAYKDGTPNKQDPYMNTSCDDCEWRVVADNASYTYYNLYCKTNVYRCQGHTDFVVICKGHERCLGHIAQDTVKMKFTYCQGYCDGHEVTEYCTGHIDLDVAVVTAFNDNVNGPTELGVAKTVNVTQESYKPRVENGFEDGDEVTVNTFSTDSSDINSYIFDYGTTPLVKENLSKYVFKEVGNEYPLPSYSAELESQFVSNPGSLVDGKGITSGLNFLKSFIDGSGLMIGNHWSDYDGADDLDKDGKVTLSDIVGAYFIAFEKEKFKDYNDDFSTQINLSNMQSVSSKFGKNHFTTGFYNYVIDAETNKATIKRIAGKYSSNEELTRADENIKEDWFRLYNLQFPGAYNKTAADTELQRWSYDIAYATSKAVGSSESYLFLPSIYTPASTEDAKRGIPGTGFISHYLENMIEKREDGLGLPSKAEAPGGTQDSIDFALTWGKTFYQDLTSLTHRTFSGDAYNTLLNIVGGNYEYYKEQYLKWKENGSSEEDIPHWILECYDMNKSKAKAAYSVAMGTEDINGIMKLKTMYIRKYLMTQKSSKFINGAKLSKDELNNKLMKLKAGDIVGYGNEIYLVLYNTSELHEIIGTKKDGTPYYSTATNGIDKGKVILLTVSNQSSEEADCIHAFAYSLELFAKKKDSIWIYSE